MLKQIVACAIVSAIFVQSVFAGLGSEKALYMGGTWTQLKEKTEGRLDVTGDRAAVFIPGKKKLPKIEIPHNSITSLEYGQKAGRRIGATIGWGATTLGIAALPMLLSKKRKHYLSIGYTIDGVNHGAVLELGKDVTRATVFTLQTRSGKEVEYESDEAREHLGN